MLKLTKLLAGIFFAFLSIFCISQNTASAQTYYYRGVAQYDKNGVKSAFNTKRYLTFVNNKSLVYESDANGNSSGLMRLQYAYKGIRDGKHVYQQFGQSAYGQVFWSDGYLYFNSDFSRLNDWGSFFGITFVYERGNPGDEVATPKNFY